MKSLMEGRVARAHPLVLPVSCQESSFRKGHWVIVLFAALHTRNMEAYGSANAYGRDRPVLLGIQCEAPVRLHSQYYPEQRENCDHIHHAVEIVNNKTDGLFDDLTVTIELTEEAQEGCSDGLMARMAYRRLRDQYGERLAAVIGGGCSGELSAVSSASFAMSSGRRALSLSRRIPLRQASLMKKRIRTLHG